MSNRVSGRIFRSASAFALIAATAGALAGCSSLGSRSFGSFDNNQIVAGSNSQIVTGSTVSAAGGDLNQPLPQALTPQMGSSAKYLPPADVGRAAFPDPLTTGAIVTGGTGQGISPGIVSQDLPSLTPSPEKGSTQTMPAQLSRDMAEATPSIATPVTPAAKLTIVPQKSYTHVIESGESLYAIARKYDVTTDSIVLTNGLGSPDKIFVGQKITIPGAVGKPTQSALPKMAIDNIATGGTTTTAKAATTIQPMPAKPLSIKSAPQRMEVASAEVVPVKVPTRSKPAVTTEPKVDNLDKFRWPVSGKIVLDFAASKGTGINIEVPEGTAIRAAETGMVIYVGSAVEGYGNLILVKHDNGFVSAYAHLSQITVAKGDKVMRGDAIGLSGNTGSVTRPQLHFELRQGAKPVDPVPMLAS